MDPHRFRIISPKDIPDYRERAGVISEASWPEFMLHDPIANENWHELFDRFPEYQFALLDIHTNRMVAIGNSLPFHWDGEISDLPDGGWDWVFLKAIEDDKSGIRPNVQSAIQIAIHPEYQKLGLSAGMIQAMRSIGVSRGFKSLVAPVRPSQKSQYPLISIDEYIQWTNHEGLPFDAWLRAHARMGARIIRACHEAMTISGSRADWEAWTGLQFPQSGRYILPGALLPMEMDVEKDQGLYVEPNVWTVHTIG
jgi:GNAT superfamily N-acetyltransferase